MNRPPDWPKALPGGGSPFMPPTAAPAPPVLAPGALPLGWLQDYKTFQVGQIPILSATAIEELSLFSTPKECPTTGIDVYIGALPIPTGAGAYQIRVYSVSGSGLRTLVDTWMCTLGTVQPNGSGLPELACSTRGAATQWEVAIRLTGGFTGAGTQTITAAYVAGPMTSQPREDFGVKRFQLGTFLTTVIDTAAIFSCAKGHQGVELVALEIMNTLGAVSFLQVFRGLTVGAGGARLDMSFQVPANSSRFVWMPRSPGVLNRYDSGPSLIGSSTPITNTPLAAAAMFVTAWVK